MKCPICDCLEDKVIESRTLAEGRIIRRRRECNECNYRFTSYEHIEEKQLMVIKRDSRRESFQLEKLEAGIRRALDKRSVSQVQVEELIHQIHDKAIAKAGFSHEIQSSDLGEMVMKKLKELDKIAYIRFASVYRQFEDVKEFVKEIKKLNQKKD